MKKEKDGYLEARCKLGGGGIVGTERKLLKKRNSGEKRRMEKMKQGY